MSPTPTSATVPARAALAGDPSDGHGGAVVSTVVPAVSASATSRPAPRLEVGDLAANPSLLASLALEAERDVLAIPAGLQDRVVQTYGGTVSMQFSARQTSLVHGRRVGTYRALGPLPGHLFVACRPGSATESGAVHSAIDPTDPDVVASMQRLANAARSAERARTTLETDLSCTIIAVRSAAASRAAD